MSLLVEIPFAKLQKQLMTSLIKKSENKLKLKKEEEIEEMKPETHKQLELSNVKLNETIKTD